VVLGAVGPQEGQPLPTTPDTYQEPLADQQPAGVEQAQAPDRMAGIDEIPRVGKGALVRPSLTPWPKTS